jgi:hypothetical protein
MAEGKMERERGRRNMRTREKRGVQTKERRRKSEMDERKARGRSKETI